MFVLSNEEKKTPPEAGSEKRRKQNLIQNLILPHYLTTGNK